MSNSLMAIRAAGESNTAEQKRASERKRNVLVLINQYLVEGGYIEAAERLQHETGGVLNKFVAADNMDLSLILTDYESYYEMRFDKKPKLVRKLNDGEEAARIKPKSESSAAKKSSSSSGSQSKDKKSGGDTDSSSKLPSVTGATPAPPSVDTADATAFGISGTGIAATTAPTKGKQQAAEDKTERHEDRLLRPPPSFGGDMEMRQLANVISREIYQESPNVWFSDIIQLEEAKRLLIEAVQLPLRFPFLFTGILRPWRGILLHGPPGTGKTLLAKAVATECHTTFFNISASTLVSKWRGDSEKLVRVLFEVARYHSPSTIFMDEIDSILTSRDGEGGEHESSRRMKTELMIQMDGVKGSSTVTEQVFVMAASNLPWDLDVAVLRRLEKRVLVGLPEAAARELMFSKHLSERCTPGMDFAALASVTEGYSGADLELVCRESAMMPVRRMMRRIEDLDRLQTEEALRAVPDPPPAASKIPGGAGSRGGRTAAAVQSAQVAAVSSSRPAVMLKATVQMAEVEALLAADPVTFEDVTCALSTTKPSSDGKITKYEAWQKDYGSV